MSDFERMLDEKASEAEEIIKSFLPAEEGYQKKVIEAMNYSVMAGGKRINDLTQKHLENGDIARGELLEEYKQQQKV